MTAHLHFSSPPRPGTLLVAVVVGLLVAAGGVSYLGTREPATSPPRETAEPERTPSPLPVDGVVRIELPHEAFPVPFGGTEEDRTVFMRACTQCHSTRLVFTQPRFASPKWAATVKKMTTAYKAPISDQDQKRIVAFLSSVHGES